MSRDFNQPLHRYYLTCASVSIAGDVITAQRAHLKPRNVDRLIFLKKEYDFKKKNSTVVNLTSTNLTNKNIIITEFTFNVCDLLLVH